MFSRLLSVVLTAWAGSLWTLCAIVAPSLFVVVADRKIAGDLAGHFFTVESWLGLALGGIALSLLSRGAEGLRNAPNYALIVVTAAAPISNEIILRPFMESARAAGNMQLFGVMHGAAALLFGFACMTVLILVWRISATNRN